jgi:hypothetical protein
LSDSGRGRVSSDANYETVQAVALIHRKKGGPLRNVATPERPEIFPEPGHPSQTDGRVSLWTFADAKETLAEQDAADLEETTR